MLNQFKCHESNQRVYADSPLLFSRSLVGGCLVSIGAIGWPGKLLRVFYVRG